MSAIIKFFREVGDGALLALKSARAYYHYPKLILFLIAQPIVVLIISAILDIVLSYYKGMPIQLRENAISFWWDVLSKSLAGTQVIGHLLRLIGLYVSKFLIVLMQVWFINTLMAYFQHQKASLLVSLEQTFQRIGAVTAYAVLLMLIGFIPDYHVSLLAITPMQMFIFGMLLLMSLLIYIAIYVLFFFIYPIIACEKISIARAISQSVRMGVKNIGLVLGVGLVVVAFLALIAGVDITIAKYHVTMRFGFVAIAPIFAGLQLIHNLVYFLPTIAATVIYCALHHKPTGILLKS